MHDAPQTGNAEEILAEIIQLNDQLGRLKDLDAILDRILSEVRRLTRADAGTIFLVDEGKLKFSYVHNDTFLKEGEINKDIYADFAIPIDDGSIVGHVALRGEPLNIDDAYDLDPSLPFRFNKSFDQKTGYRTRSILTVPITTSQGEVAGVIQLINAKDGTGRSAPFARDAQDFMPLFANNASVAIERAIMTRELILRMMRMAELRDPAETGPHVQRVGAYSAEIYHRWALNRGVDPKAIKKNKDTIRVAAMLHDVGKVGISDKILKKPAKLDDAEFAIIKLHTVYGAQLFAKSTSEMDRMSGDIAMGHHEKWDGRGYPGRIIDMWSNPPRVGEPKRGGEIPLEARICALADVFDALTSRRSYKPPWPDEKILAVIREESGRHFDPEVVEAFLQIFDVIRLIRAKYADALSEDERPALRDETARTAADAQDRKRE
ncbi:MAG: HD domain-containing phosphohydrolase [Thermodesulfobacteriota bacterium]